MTTLNIDLLDALRKAGVDEETARRAAASVSSREERAEIVTKDFLRAELETRLAPIESDLRWTKWIITGGVGLYVLRSLIEWLR